MTFLEFCDKEVAKFYKELILGNDPAKGIDAKKFMEGMAEQLNTDEFLLFSAEHDRLLALKAGSTKLVEDREAWAKVVVRAIQQEKRSLELKFDSKGVADGYGLQWAHNEGWVVRHVGGIRELPAPTEKK